MKGRKGKAMNNNIKMIKVDSSNVDEVGYDEAEQVLYVRFLTGALYIYKGVSVYEFEGLCSASSVGSYLHRNIRNNYPYERIE